MDCSDRYVFLGQMVFLKMAETMFPIPTLIPLRGGVCTLILETWLAVLTVVAKREQFKWLLRWRGKGNAASTLPSGSDSFKASWHHLDSLTALKPPCCKETQTSPWGLTDHTERSWDSVNWGRDARPAMSALAPAVPASVATRLQPPSQTPQLEAPRWALPKPVTLRNHGT